MRPVYEAPRRAQEEQRRAQEEREEEERRVMRRALVEEEKRGAQRYAQLRREGYSRADAMAMSYPAPGGPAPGRG